MFVILSDLFLTHTPIFFNNFISGEFAKVIYISSKFYTLHKKKLAQNSPIFLKRFKTLIIWCEKDYLTIMSDKAPQTGVRTPLPSDSKEERKDKKKKPYINKMGVTFYIDYLGSHYGIYIPKNYTWDGSSCPCFHNLPALLDSSLIHDFLCENKELIGYDRQLSSMIFREVGIASGVNKAFMYLAYNAVDNFQKIFAKDKKGNKWR